MRVLVAGATGAVGRRLVPLLAAAGHSVVGLSHTAAKAAVIRQLGAEPVIADGLDRAAVHRAMEQARPEVVVHEMTALTGVTDLRRFDRVFALTNRLRTEGTDHLVAAAMAVGVRRLVAQSYCGWPYARTGGPIKSESDLLDPSPPRQMRRTLDAIRHLETTVIGAPGLAGIVLRYGALYGPNTGMLMSTVLDQIRSRRLPLIGNGGGWWSFVHVEDAAAATLAAVERGVAGIYNIVDDEPAPVREWLPALAQMAGAKSPRHVPKFVARMLAGSAVVAMMTESRAGSNAKAKRELGWQPRHASWRQGFAEVIAAQR
ncbi:MAG TPA: NAD(P)-dependent oxidoreductase [Stellaceae bacterium]|nr:NAD(P)-dependent oxidoreductase [Stellaceae bacterium]